MRGRGERSRVEELEDRLRRQRELTRRLWDALRARAGQPVTADIDRDEEAARAADLAFNAAETIWHEVFVLVVPCRRLLDPPGTTSSLSGWPVQDEMYVGHLCDGTARNLTRGQVLMMGGLDPAPPVAPSDPEMPF